MVRANILAVICACVCSTFTPAATLGTIITFRGPYPEGAGCQVPERTSVFNALTDHAVYVFYTLSNVRTGDVIQRKWINIAHNQLLVSDPVPYTGSATSGCGTTHNLTIADYPSGDWRVELWVNNVKLGETTFSILPVNQGSNSLQGFLDNADCFHIYGWGRDLSDQSNKVVVNILSDGLPVTSVTANRPRSDLPGDYAFDVPTPAAVKDGRQHTITAQFSGTQQALTRSGSGLPLRLTCATTAAPVILDINPKTVTPGVDTIFSIEGTGFKDGFSGRLRIGSSGNQLVISPGAQAIFKSSSLVQMVVKIGALDDPVTKFSLQVINPSPGNQPSNEYSGLTTLAPMRGGRIQWTPQMPPATFERTSSIPLSWTINDVPGATFSHIHGALDRDAVLSEEFAAIKRPDESAAPGLHTQTVTPFNVTAWQRELSAGVPVYFVVHAGGEKDYYSDVGRSSVSENASSRNAMQWVFDGRVDTRATGYYIKVTRTALTDGLSEYVFLVATDYGNAQGIYTFHFSMTNPVGVFVDQNSFSFQVNDNRFEDIVSGSESGWTTPQGDRSAGELGSLALGLIKGLPYKFSATLAVIQYLSELINRYPAKGPTLQASDLLRSKIADQNTYTTRRFAFQAERGFWHDQQTFTALRFKLRVREQSVADWPDFFFLVDSQSFNGLVTVESRGSARQRNEFTLNRLDWN